MKITCISDTHSQYKKLILPKADILIIAGDIDLWEKTREVVDFNIWLDKQNYKYKIIIAGNHDRFIYENNSLFRALIHNYIYLENSGCEIEGIKIWGSPITPRFNDWFFMEDRDKIQRYWNMIPNDTDILVTHGPAWGYGDKIKRGNILYQCLGCTSLLETVERIKPKYHIFGHIHGSYGIEKNEYTTFVNCSVCNEEYELVNAPIELEI